MHHCLIFTSCVIDNANHCQVILEMGAQLCPVVSAGYLNPEESFFYGNINIKAANTDMIYHLFHTS